MPWQIVQEEIDSEWVDSEWRRQWVLQWQWMQFISLTSLFVSNRFQWSSCSINLCGKIHLYSQGMNGGNHENAPLRSLTSGNKTDQQPQLLWSEICQCIYTKATFPTDFPQPYRKPAGSLSTGGSWPWFEAWPLQHASRSSTGCKQ